MAFALDKATATGGQTNFAITFAFITDPTDIVVTQNGTTLVEGAGAGKYTITGGNTVVLGTGATVGDLVNIRRTTSQAARLVDWTVPSTMVETDLDNDSLQAFYMAQEAIDIANDALGKSADESTFDAETLKIVNVVDPTSDQDAATKKYVDDTVVAGGNVPTPDNPGEDNYVLRASAGTFDWFNWLAADNTITGSNTFSGTTTTFSGTTVAVSATANLSGAVNMTGTGLKTITGPMVLTKGGDLASAGTLVIGTDGNAFDVTGTTTITAMTVAAGRSFRLQFDGALVLTHSATLFLNNAASNITTAAGDVALCYARAANDVEVTVIRADGTALVAPAAGTTITAGTTLTKSPLVASTTTTQAHGLGAVPKYIQVLLECTTADNSWDVGDVLDISSLVTNGHAAATDRGMVVAVDATNLRLFIDAGSAGLLFWVPEEDNTAAIDITIANWEVNVIPYGWS